MEACGPPFFCTNLIFAIDRHWIGVENNRQNLLGAKFL
jgi:hypothetical protein